MKPRIYIETSIPSFYYETRQDAAFVARRDWTQQWWEKYRHDYELVSSQAVLDELNKGNYPKREKCVALLNEIPFLTIEPEITTIAQTYIQHKLMPKDLGGDVLHLANARKFGHIKHINTLLGLYVPILTTPLELLGEQS